MSREPSRRRWKRQQRADYAPVLVFHALESFVVQVLTRRIALTARRRDFALIVLIVQLVQNASAQDSKAHLQVMEEGFQVADAADASYHPWSWEVLQEQR